MQAQPGAAGFVLGLPRSLEDQFPGYVESVALNPEPRYLTIDGFDNLIRHAVACGASEVNLQSEEPAYIQVLGEWCRITKRRIAQREIEVIANHLYGDNGTARLNAAEELNDRYILFKDPGGVRLGDAREKHMLRYNITPCEYRDGDNGIQITMRVIRPAPPSLDELGVESDLRPHLFHSSGLALIVGPTGSGKTTLLAAIVRAILENPNSHRKISLLDSPPEFAFYDVPRASALLSQHNVPKHIKTYALGIRNSLRRATGVIVVGESKSRETIEAAIEGANTAQALYTTGHAGSCAEAMVRFGELFDASERMTKVFALIDTLRVIVVQRLVRRIDVDGRIALREYLVMDRDVRDRLVSAATMVEVQRVMRELVETRGQSLLASARRAFDAGQISGETLSMVERESRATLHEDYLAKF